MNHHRRYDIETYVRESLPTNTSEDVIDSVVRIFQDQIAALNFMLRCQGNASNDRMAAVVRQNLDSLSSYTQQVFYSKVEFKNNSELLVPAEGSVWSPGPGVRTSSSRMSAQEQDDNNQDDEIYRSQSRPRSNSAANSNRRSLKTPTSVQERLKSMSIDNDDCTVEFYIAIASSEECALITEQMSTSNPGAGRASGKHSGSNSVPMISNGTASIIYGSSKHSGSSSDVPTLKAPGSKRSSQSRRQNESNENLSDSRYASPSSSRSSDVESTALRNTQGIPTRRPQAPKIKSVTNRKAIVGYTSSPGKTAMVIEREATTSSVAADKKMNLSDRRRHVISNRLQHLSRFSASQRLPSPTSSSLQSNRGVGGDHRELSASYSVNDSNPSHSEPMLSTGPSYHRKGGHPDAFSTLTKLGPEDGVDSPPRKGQLTRMTSVYEDIFMEAQLVARK